jgi:hypothetical protein
MEYSGAGRKLIHEKNRSKKSRDSVPLRTCTFFERVLVSCDAVVDVPDEVRVHGRPAPRLQVRQPLVTGRAEGVHHGVPGLWGAQHDRGAGQGNHRPYEHAQVRAAYTLIKNKIKFSSYIRKFRMHGSVAKLQSSSCMGKYLRIAS